MESNFPILMGLQNGDEDMWPDIHWPDIHLYLSEKLRVYTKARQLRAMLGPSSPERKSTGTS